MITFDKNIWTSRDPDNVLSLDVLNFDLSRVKFSGEIHPREDLVYLKNRRSSIIIDLGYYGCEVQLSGSWTIYVVDGLMSEGWHDPIEKHIFNFSDFEPALNRLQLLIAKYT